jgi:hypothetical protein
MVIRNPVAVAARLRSLHGIVGVAGVLTSAQTGDIGGNILRSEGRNKRLIDRVLSARPAGSS